MNQDLQSVSPSMSAETVAEPRLLVEEVLERLRDLIGQGELLPNRGAIVTPITVTTVREMFVLLGALEALAGELACVNASDADIAEIRALHYQMLAHHTRGELAPASGSAGPE